MDKSFGYFLITIGLVVLFWQSGLVSYDLIKSLVKTPYFMPLAFIAMGLVFVVSSYVKFLKVFSGVLNFLFFVLVIVWFFSGSSFLVHDADLVNSVYDVSNGLSIDGSAGEIVVEMFNSTHLRVSSETASSISVAQVSSGVLKLNLGVGKILIKSLPSVLDSVSVDLGVGKVEFLGFSNSFYSANYRVGVGKFSSPGFYCFSCNGERVSVNNVGVLSVNVGMGEVGLI